MELVDRKAEEEQLVTINTQEAWHALMHWSNLQVPASIIGQAQCGGRAIRFLCVQHGQMDKWSVGPVYDPQPNPTTQKPFWLPIYAPLLLTHPLEETGVVVYSSLVQRAAVRCTAVWFGVLWHAVVECGLVR